MIDLDTTDEGTRAAAVILRGRAAIASATPEASRQVAQLEQEIAALIARKATLAEDIYYAELERLFVELARLQADLEASR